MSRQVVALLESRRSLLDLRQTTTHLHLAQRDLRLKSAFLETLGNSSLDGIVVVDTKGRKAFQNQRFTDLSTHSLTITDGPDEQKPLRWAEENMRDPATFAHQIAYLTAHPEASSRDEIEMRDGTVLDRYSAPVLDADGKCLGRVWTFRDITEHRRTEETLRQQKSELRSILNFIPAIICFKDTENRMLRVNKRLADAFGKSIDEVEGRSTEEFCPEQAEGYFLDDLEVIRSGRPKFGILESFLDAEQRPVWIESTKVPVHDKDGRITGVIVMSLDITEHRHAEEALRESEQRFSGAFEHAAIGMALVSPAGLSLRVNPALCQIVGYAETELLGRALQEITHPEDTMRHVENRRRLLAGECESYQLEECYLHRQGHQLTILASVSLVRDGQGKPAYLVVLLQDVTRRKLVEEQLFQSRETLRGILDQIPQRVFWQDRASVFQGGNKAFALDMGLDDPIEVVGKTDAHAPWKAYAHLYPADDLAAQDRPSSAACFTEACVSIDGKSVWLRTSKTPLHDRQGRITGILGTYEDITARKCAEAELEKLHQQLVEASRRTGMAEIAANVLHNVGNVLTSVNISTDFIVRNLRKSKISSLARVSALLSAHATDLGDFITHDPQGKHLPAFLMQLSEQLALDQTATLSELDSLQRNIEHIREIVAVQQDYAIYGGLKESISVVRLVEDCLRMSQGSLSRHGVEITRELGEVPAIFAEKHKILQILVNLLRNAKSACQDSNREDSHLTVRVSRAEGLIKIAVIDNGVGIAPENLSRIFAHGFTTRKGGHGFGLHSAAQSAQQMGGTLTVQSAGLGHGAIFTLKLPESEDRPLP